MKTVTEMASRGLRTLCLAYADVSADNVGPLDKLEGPPELPLTACCMLGIKVSQQSMTFLLFLKDPKSRGTLSCWGKKWCLPDLASSSWTKTVVLKSQENSNLCAECSGQFQEVRQTGKSGLDPLFLNQDKSILMQTFWIVS